MRGRVAQLVEQRPFKAWVAGSIPAALTIIPKDLGRKQRKRLGKITQSAELIEIMTVWRLKERLSDQDFDVSVAARPSLVWF
jgi:hypothetical protein